MVGGSSTGRRRRARLLQLALPIAFVGGLLFWVRDGLLSCEGALNWARASDCRPVTPLKIGLQAERKALSGQRVLFIVSGRIENGTSRIQRVPDLYFTVIGDSGGRGGSGAVGDWRLAAPIPSLARGQSATFTGALQWADQAHSLKLDFGGRSVSIDLDPRRPWFGSDREVRPRTKVACAPSCRPSD
jgi:hypothetical protein